MKTVRKYRVIFYGLANEVLKRKTFFAKDDDEADEVADSIGYSIDKDGYLIGAVQLQYLGKVEVK